MLGLSLTSLRYGSQLTHLLLLTIGHLMIQVLLLRHLPILLVIPLRPNSILSGTQNPFRIQRSFYLIIQLYLRVVIETVGICDLIHDAEMGSVFAPTALCCVVYESANEPVCATTTIRVFAVEDYADYVVHFALCEVSGL